MPPVRDTSVVGIKIEIECLIWCFIKCLRLRSWCTESDPCQKSEHERFARKKISHLVPSIPLAGTFMRLDEASGQSRPHSRDGRRFRVAGAKETTSNCCSNCADCCSNCADFGAPAIPFWLQTTKTATTLY